MTGSKLATDQVQSNPILGQLFGQDGALSRSVGTEKNLQSQGFKLQPQDGEAYGQASGNIARMFGQGSANLSQDLASRGLAAAPSGAAGAEFSGLQGNRTEQLAQAQMNIANQRMNNTMQRIGQQQKFITQLGQQGNTAIGDQYGRNLAGVQNQQGSLNDNIKNSQEQQSLQQNQANEQFAQQQNTRTPSFWEKMGNAATGGISKSVGSLFSAPADAMERNGKLAAGGGMGGAGAGKTVR
jgi:hypothetical protein